MRTTPIGRSTAFAIRAAAVVRRRAKPPCVWPLASSPKWLKQRYGVLVRGFLSQLGEIRPAGFDWDAVEDNPFFWPHAAQVPELETYMDALRKSGDSVGARVDVLAGGVPAGWGEPIYGKLDAELAAALMSINAVKGVEIGDGFASAAQRVPNTAT